MRHGEPVKPGGWFEVSAKLQHTKKLKLVKHLNLKPQNVNAVCQFGAALEIWKNYFGLLASVHGTSVITACLSKGFSGSVL